MAGCHFQEIIGIQVTFARNTVNNTVNIFIVNKKCDTTRIEFAVTKPLL